MRGRRSFLVGGLAAGALAVSTMAHAEPASRRTARAESSAQRMSSNPAGSELAQDGAPSDNALGFAASFIGVDARVEGMALFKRYATATDASYASDGAGGGVGVSASIHWRGPATVGADRSASFIDFELGISEAFHYVGWREGDGRSVSFAENETAAILGIQWASGRLREGSRARWSGRVFELAWVPTYAHIVGNADVASDGRLNPVGLRVSADFGSMDLESSLAGPLFRVSMTWLPYVGRNLPTMLTAGVGCVFY